MDFATGYTPKFKLLGRFKDEDATEKFVFEFPEGIIEITWIKNKSGIAVFCLPTHHFCNLGCRFCHLTEENKNNKKMAPILAENLSEALKIVLNSYVGSNKLLFSFMGVGEPFLNINLIFGLYDYFKKNAAQKIGLALATMLLTQQPLGRLAGKVKNDNLPLKIHFSLHSPIEKIRKNIIPSASAKIDECLRSLTHYRNTALSNPIVVKNLSQFHKQTDFVEIHYTLIDKINDSDEELAGMFKIGNKYKIPLKLIKFNPTKALCPSPKTGYWLQKLSENYDAPVCVYAPPGANIGSSCGQFTKHYYLGSNSEKEAKEFEIWKKKYEIPV